MKVMMKKYLVISLISLYMSGSFAIAEVNSRDERDAKIVSVDYLVSKATMPEILARQNGMTFEQLNQINQNQLNIALEIKEGQIIKLPQNSPSLNVSEVAKNEHVNPLESTLPELGDGKLVIDPSATQQIIAASGLGNYVQGTSDENIANFANTAATTDWSRFNVKELTDNAEETLKNQLKSNVNQAAQDLLGRFGKAQVTLSVDDKGNLSGSSLNLLSPLYDEKEGLLFSQIGIHGQGAGDDKRTIGNFGIGYRYESDAWLAGGNVFIDHDFTGSNTRLGLGAEYWQDSIKLATNVYTPLSSWKESDVMKNYEGLIYDERPASGFDIRAKSYLPNHPEFGGSLVYEQYFGDEVALFSTQDRQKDPYALTLGIDYMPIPLITTELSHKIGKGGESDSRINVNLNLQLGTPIEEQLDPSNVASARSLKGSRYDMVDRNYDIVFEYKKEDFSIKLNGPDTAMLGSSVTITPTINSRSAIESYEWIVTDKVGNVFAKQNYDSKSLSFTINNLIDHYVRLKVRTANGYEAISEALVIHVTSAQSSSSLKVLNGEAWLVDFSKLTSFAYADLKALDPNFKAELIFEAKTLDGNPFDFTINPDIVINWRINGLDGSTFRQYTGSSDPKIDPVQFIYVQGDEPNQLKIIAIADESFIAVNGASYTVDVVVSSYVDKTIFAEAKIKFINFDETLTPIGIDPNNLIIQIIQIPKGRAFSPTTDIVSESGFLNGIAIIPTVHPIEQASRYEARILTGPDSENLTDVTDRYVDSIIWLYWDPVSQREVTVPNKIAVTSGERTYRGLEDCKQNSTYLTQIDNYTFNELATGEIGENDFVIANSDRKNALVTEQGMRLAVQFDFLEVHEPKNITAQTCEPTEANKAQPGSYIGFDESNKAKKTKWSGA